MSLNIKDPETHKLVRELARETGTSMTKAVREAVRERLDQVRRHNGRGARKDALLAIARRFRSRVKGPVVPLEEMLYDEKGLPK